MFEHLKKLEITDRTSWVSLPQVGPDVRVEVRFAGEENVPFFEASLARVAERRGAVSETDDFAEKLFDSVRENRAEDRELYPDLIVVGWEGVEDTKGKAIPFTVEHAREFCTMLPAWIFEKIRVAAQSPERFLGPGERKKPNSATLAKN